MVEASGQPEHLRNDFEAVRVEAVAVNKLRNGDVALGCERRKQVEALEDETDFTPAEFGARRVAQRGEVIAVHQDFATRRLREPSD